MGWFRRDPQPTTRTELIVSVESGSVSVTLALFPLGDREQQIQVLWSTRRECVSVAWATFDRLKQRVVATLDEILEEAHRQLPEAKVSRVSVVLGAPWYQVVFQTTTLSRAVVTPITKKDLSVLREDAIAVALDKISSEGFFAHPWCIEATTAELIIDGVVASLIPQEAKTIGVHWYVSFADSEFTDKIQASISKWLPNVIVRWNTMTYALGQTLEQTYDLEQRGLELVLYIGDEYSEGVAMRSLHIEGLVSFAKGHATVLRQTMSALGTTFDDIQARLMLQKKNALTQESASELTQALHHACEEYAHDVFKMLLSFAQSRTIGLPTKIYLLTHHIAYSWHQHVFQSEQLVKLAQEYGQTIHVASYAPGQSHQIVGTVADGLVHALVVFAFVTNE